ncbi:MAG: FUSC family protein [Thomasclavelia sp.]|jgi:hypothetical protein|nr:FUSC family protein [Thomasclavelia sp.]
MEDRIEKQNKIKKILVEIVKKLPIFLFCVLFINGYNFMFGKENSIVGVIILMGLLILLGEDLGYKSNQAAGCIFFLFVVLAFMPKLSLINPYLGLVINLVSLTLIMILSAHDLSSSGYLPFAMGYIMIQGYDVTGVLFTKRWVSLLIGGALIAVVYLLSHKNNKNDMSIIDLVKANNITSTRTQWYIRLVLTISLVMFVGDLANFPKAMWISLTVLSLSTPLVDEYKKRAVFRIPATIIGSVLVFSLFELYVPNQYQVMLILVAGFLSMFITSYFVKTIYNSFSALITAALLFPAKEAVGIRIVANLIGVVVSVISVVLFSKIFDGISAKENINRN